MTINILVRASVLCAILICSGCANEDAWDHSLDGDWLFQVDSSNLGVKEQWFIVGYDRSAWRTHSLPDYWDKYDDLASYDGAGWYEKSFTLNTAHGPYSIYFAGVDDDADVWLNGVPVGSHSGYGESFSFDVSSELRQGRNEVVVRVVDKGGPGGIYESVHIVRSEDVKRLMKSKFSDLPSRSSADWVRNAVVYEVYLRSFSKEGTFKGLEKRIPELKALGVTVLWLMPIQPIGELGRKGRLGSPYSVQDYYGINPEFGSLDDFKSLVASVHRQGLKIIIDLVANHTSWDSKLMFEHPEWFMKNKEGAIVSPNADWTDVAQLDYRQHELRKYMINMMAYWVRDIGIDGYRCDVADMVPLDFWEMASRELSKIKPVMMLAEGKNPEDHLKAFDLTYSWNLYDVLDEVVEGRRSVKVLDDILVREQLLYPKNALRMRFNSNHDKNFQDSPAVRLYTTAGAKATIALIYTYPGVPLVYNGDEVCNSRKLSLLDKVDIDWSKGKDLRGLYSRLAELRSQHQALRNGDYHKVWCSDSARVYAFERCSGNDTVCVVINFSKGPKNVKIESTDNLLDAIARRTIVPEKKKVELNLPPYGFFILIPDENKERK